MSSTYHIFCKHLVKILQGLLKAIFSRNDTKKALASVEPKGYILGHSFGELLCDEFENYK